LSAGVDTRLGQALSITQELSASPSELSASPSELS
jgi:hypothetical protein